MTSLLHTLAISTPFHSLLAQADYTTQSTGSTVGGLIGGLVYLAFVIFVIAGLWKVFVKAGKPGWAAIVPFYNVIVMLQISGKPLWWIVLLFIPIVNIIIWIFISIALAKSFGKGAGFGIGIAFLSFIFIPILGYGSDTYQGPAIA